MSSTCLKVGKGNAHLRDSAGRPSPVRSRRACLTPTQREVLRPTELVACGSFACVYDREPGVDADGTSRSATVVKLTQDETDVAAMQLAGDDPRVVRLKSAYRLADPVSLLGSKSIYAAVVERLDRAPTALRRIFARTPAWVLATNYDKSPAAGTENYAVGCSTSATPSPAGRRSRT